MKKNEQLIAVGIGVVVVIVGAVLYYQYRQKEQPKSPFAPDSSIYSTQDYTNLVLDSTLLVSFYQTHLVSDSIQKDVSAFYQRRGYQYAWFSENKLTNAALNFNQQRESHISDFADSSLYNAQIDTLLLNAQVNTAKFLANKKNLQTLELLLTTTFFKYTDKAFTGAVKDPIDLDWFIPRKKKSYQALLDTLVSAKGQPIREPVNRYYTLLKEKLRQYRAIEKQGGWGSIDIPKKTIKKGDSDSLLFSAKKTLVLLGDLEEMDTTDVFTDALGVAVKRFQHRMGLPETGKMDANTAQELNQPISARIKQIMINMERLRWVPAEMEQDMLLINIPEFKLHVFEQGKQAWQCNVVVGKEATKTSIFKGNLSNVVLNPYWVVTSNIVNNEILPRLKRSPGYLARNNMEVVSGNTVLNPYTINWKSYNKNVPYTIRQKPGKNNSLGKVKFLFPNPYSVYLHDTPSKSLFERDERAFSHGCIRVHKPMDFAAFLLSEQGVSPKDIAAIVGTGRNTAIALKTKIPIIITYWTCAIDEKNHVFFFKDIYGRDKAILKALNL